MTLFRIKKRLQNVKINKIKNMFDNIFINLFTNIFFEILENSMAANIPRTIKLYTKKKLNLNIK